MGSIAQILLARTQLRMDMLLEYPLSSDPSTWSYASWVGYSSLLIRPILLYNTDGIIGYFKGQFTLGPRGTVDVRAVGFQFAGATVFLAEFVQPSRPLGLTADLRVDFICQPWEPPP